MEDTLKNVGDVAAGTIGIATVFQWLPPLAAAITIIYTALRIIEWVRNERWKVKK